MNELSFDFLSGMLVMGVPFFLSLLTLFKFHSVLNWKDSEIKKLKDELSKQPKKRRKEVDYGDFTEYGVRVLEAEYCKAIQLGTVGWGVSFIAWLEFRGLKHEGMFRILKTPNYEE